ncbi:bifunctional hydroxymethylpyrimidine kinase/phosphomethylpyrimidine kinase [Persephonella sp.]
MLIKKVLTVAGSDNSGGAGIQADLKVFSAFNLYGMSAVTSITIQNTLGVLESIPVSGDTLFRQISSVAEDIGVDGFKAGMLQTEENVLALFEAVRRYDLGFFVLDTVIKSKNGKYLLNEDAIEVFKNKLIPKADIVTPNTDEAEVLTGISVRSKDDMVKAGKEILKMGAKGVIVKGGHIPDKDTVYDLFLTSEDMIFLEFPYVRTKHTHGTGCTLSAAVISCVVKGYDIIKSVRIARAYTQGAIENSLNIGKGTGSLNHFWTEM